MLNCLYSGTNSAEFVAVLCEAARVSSLLLTFPPKSEQWDSSWSHESLPGLAMTLTPIYDVGLYGSGPAAGAEGTTTQTSGGATSAKRPGEVLLPGFCRG